MHALQFMMIRIANRRLDEDVLPLRAGILDIIA